MQLPVRVEIGLEQHLVEVVKDWSRTKDDAQLAVAVQAEQIEIAAAHVGPAAIDQGRLGMDAARIQMTRTPAASRRLAVTLLV